MIENHEAIQAKFFLARERKVHLKSAIAALLLSTIVAQNSAHADEDGISFWLPGLFGSLAAVPQQPGFSLATINYFDTVSAGNSVARAREFSIGDVPASFKGNVSANVHATLDLGLINATYTFASPVFGGLATIGLLAFPGYNDTSLNGRVDGVVTLPPPVGSVPFSKSVNLNQSTVGFGDLYPQAILRWNQGINNFMTYATGDIPVGTYNSRDLANLGIGHGAIDSGAGYTYLNPQTGHEFSAVAGFTYNFLNPYTQYQSGVDFHLDWAASQFLSKQLLVGVVGYVYREIGCDSGSGDHVGCFQSQVFSAGPQIGYSFPVSQDLLGYVNLKAYGEFGAMNRPSGANVWLTFALSPAPPRPVTKD
ncbi:MAG: transporter [Methylovirgula sp.]|nr:transporter [Methylovirgula sp.]